MHNFENGQIYFKVHLAILELYALKSQKTYNNVHGHGSWTFTVDFGYILYRCIENPFKHIRWSILQKVNDLNILQNTLS